MYDYNSREDSPNRGMELELSFKNGDTITVYGGMVSWIEHTSSLCTVSVIPYIGIHLVNSNLHGYNSVYSSIYVRALMAQL